MRLLCRMLFRQLIILIRPNFYYFLPFPTHRYFSKKLLLHRLSIFCLITRLIFALCLLNPILFCMPQHWLVLLKVLFRLWLMLQLGKSSRYKVLWKLWLLLPMLLRLLWFRLAPWLFLGLRLRHRPCFKRLCFNLFDLVLDFLLLHYPALL